MSSATKSTTRPGALVAAVLIILCFQSSNGQGLVYRPVLPLDTGVWGTSSLTAKRRLIQDAAQTGLTTQSSAPGGETDILLKFLDGDDNSEAAVEARPDKLGFQIRSTTNSRVQAAIVWDGKDLSWLDVQATNGLDALDLTVGETFDRLVLSFENTGQQFTGALVVYSAPDESSACEFAVPTGDFKIECPYNEWVSENSGANFRRAQAVILFIGSDGGAEGPVEALVHNIGMSRPERVPPPPSGEEVVLYEHIGEPSGTEIYVTNWGLAEGGKWNSRGAGYFQLERAAILTLLVANMDWTFAEDRGRAAEANIEILADDDGHPGSVIHEYNLLPVESTDNPFVFRLPADGGLLPPGGYWAAFEVLSDPGFDIYAYGSEAIPEHDAHFENPGDGWHTGCTSWAPVGDCLPTNDHSFGLRVEGVVESLALADIGVSVTLNDTVFVVGDTIKVTTEVTNNGSIDSPETVVKVVLPNSPETFSPSQGTCTELESFYVVPLRCDLGLLAPGEKAAIEVTFPADFYYAVGGGYDLGAFFDPGEFPDQDPDNDSEMFDLKVVGRISVAKEAPSTAYLPGKQIPFRITLKNISNVTVDGVRFTDTYPVARLSLQPGGACDGPTPTGNTGSVECEVGALGPGEERVFELGFDVAGESGQREKWPNRVTAYSERGAEDADEFQFDVVAKATEEIILSLLGVGGTSSLVSKRVFEPIDVYLNEALIANDISIGQSTAFTPITLTEYPFLIYLVPGSAPDRSSAFDTIRVELSGAEESLSSGIAITIDESGGSQAVVLNDARTAASDPSQVDMAVIHAAPGLPLLDVELMTTPETTIIADDFVFGETSEYAEIETPGAYNLIISPDGSPEEAEIFRLELNTPGEAYMVVIAPGGVSGKLDGISVYAIDSQGNVVQPAVVTSDEATDPEMPASFALHGNYPNPFNPTTTVRYDIPQAAAVEIKIHDALGRTVTTLGTWHQAPGTYTATWNAEGMPSGIYFVRMEAGSFVETKKMILLK